MPAYIDHNGNRLEIGKELGRGGEAVAHELLRDASRVVKLYNTPPDDSKHSDKLRAMIRLTRPEILKFAAWPEALVLDSSTNKVCGVLMSKVKGRQIHDLYNPSSRRIYFPSADWRFLIRTASNFAVAVDTLHRAGIVIGDINQGNVFVSEDAIVRLIDCDSFQIHSGTSIYRCPVGVPHFTPPELQSENLSSVDRTVNHDLFGVAVMIFHLVMGGRHPFSGRYHGDKDFPLEERIKQHHFAFGRQRQYYGIAPPPFTPLLNDLPTDIQDLFENAFQPSSGTRNRPSAYAWHESLKQFEQKLSQCDSDPGHYHLRSARCPWCCIIKDGGPNIFVTASYSQIQLQAESIDLQGMVEEIKRFPENLEPSLRIRYDKLTSKSADQEMGQFGVSPETELFLKIMLGACAAGAFVFFFAGIQAGAAIFGAATLMMILLLIILNIRFHAKEAEFRQLSEERDRKMKKLRTRLEMMFRDATEAIHFNKQQVLKITKSIDNLDTRRFSTLKDLETRARNRQFENYLARHFISDARLPGIGPSRIAMLESSDINSALEIDRAKVELLPGFGTLLVNTLLEWKAELIRKFQYNPSQGIPVNDMIAVNHRFTQEKIALQKELMAGLKEISMTAARYRSSIQGFLIANDLID